MDAASAPDTASGGNQTGGTVNEGQTQPAQPTQPAQSNDQRVPTSGQTASAPQPQQAPPQPNPQPQQEQLPQCCTGPIPECHYEALGVKETANDDDIKKAFKELSRILHPDKNSAPDAKERFQRVNEAKAFLMDRQKRAGYDAKRYTTKLMKKLGMAYNQQVENWVYGALVRHAEAKVEEVTIDRHLADILPQHFQQLQLQSGANFFSMHTNLQGVVLIGGTPAIIRSGKDLMTSFLKELQGQRAPHDGMVFILPSDQKSQLPVLAHHFQNWSWQYGSTIHAASADRVVVRGGTRWPAVVAALQAWVDFRGVILNTQGQELDCWRFAHMCELGGISGGLLPPNRDPDLATVRKLFQYAMPEQQTKLNLVDFAVQVLKKVKATTPIVKAATSLAVQQEYHRLPVKQGAPLLCALAALQTSMSPAASAISSRFAMKEELQTLQRLGPFLIREDAMLLRAKGYTAAKEAVPDDSKWHPWEEILRPDGKLAVFWKDLRKFLQEKGKALSLSVPPAEWHTVPEIMHLVLKNCAGKNLQVDAEKGIFHAKEAEEKPAAPASAPTKSSTVAHSAAEAPETNLTLVEHAEDVMLDLRKQRPHDASEYMELGMVTQTLQKRTGHEAEKFSKKWYDQHKLSFDVKKAGSSDYRVKLTQGGQKRAEVRFLERQRRHGQQDEIQVVKQVLPKMRDKAEPPGIFQEKELCSLLILLASEEPGTFSQGLPGHILRKLCHNDKTDDLLNSIAPFNMAMVMRAVVNLRSKQFFHEEGALVAIMRAASLEMHDTDKPAGTRPWAPLTVVRDSVLAACKEPFVSLFEKRTDLKDKMLPASTALRVNLELTMEQSVCPPCLSQNYGNFRVFAELCGALANLYGMVWSHLGSDHIQPVEEAFAKLAMLCQTFCQDLSHKDPRGLGRLAYAFAQIGLHERSTKLKGASEVGLAQIGAVLLRSDMKDEDGWDLPQLAEITCCFKSDAQKHPDLFRRLGAVAARLPLDKLKRETAVRLIAGFQNGKMKDLGQFLKRLKTNGNGWFKKHLPDAQEKELSTLLAGMVHAEDVDAIEAVDTYMKKDRKDWQMGSLVAMLKELHECSHQKASSLKIILQQKIGDVLSRSKAAPDDVESFLLICSDSRARNRLVELCSHRKKLENLPKATGNTWSGFNISLESTLAPFVRGKCRAPRLEAAYAGRIMQGLEQCGVFQNPPRQQGDDFVKSILTAALHFSEDLLVSMPALVQSLVLGLQNLPLQQEAGMVKTLVQTMLRVGQAEDSDDALATWTTQIEDAIIKEAASRRLPEMRWDAVEMTLAGQEFKKLQKEVSDSLGQSWLSIILARSRRLSWQGHQVHLHPPRPHAALRDFAQKMGDLLPPKVKNEVLQLPVEVLPPKRLTPPKEVAKGGEVARSRSRERPEPQAKATAKAVRAQLEVSGCEDPNLARALEGGYRTAGFNHSKVMYKKIAPDPTGSVDAVYLYYWDDPEDPEKLDQGWWFSNAVGGELAWMHNPKGGVGPKGNAPPMDGWEFGLKINYAAFGLGASPAGKAKAKAKAKGTAKPKPSAVGPPAKRPREEEDERHVQLKEWLNGLDGGKGAMMMYFDALKQEFEGDLCQIAAARMDNPKAAPVDQIEPSFWSAIDCKKGVHKIHFANGIIKLPT